MFEALLIMVMIFFVMRESTETEKTCDTIVVKKEEKNIHNKNN